MTRYMLRRLAQAAALRVRAQGWAEVAKAVKSRVEVCRRWPDRYPAEWRVLYREAQRMAWEETNAEALWVLTRMAASGDEKAAKLLERYGGRLRGGSERPARARRPPGRGSCPTPIARP